MDGKTLTRADLADVVVRKVGIRPPEAAELVEQVIGEICNALERGESVKMSSFATFDVADKAERIGRNPKTGEEAVITPRRVIAFSASNILKARVLAAHRKRLSK